jgi:hypothetical protein
VSGNIKLIIVPDGSAKVAGEVNARQRRSLGRRGIRQTDVPHQLMLGHFYVAKHRREVDALAAVHIRELNSNSNCCLDHEADP